MDAGQRRRNSPGGRRASDFKFTEYQGFTLTARAEPPQKWGVGAAAAQNLLIINILQ